MPSKKDSKTTKTIKNEKRITKKSVDKKEKSDLQKNITLSKDDKILEKVEKYVDKNREKTSQEIMERKSKRPVRNYQEGDLELLISRVSAESNPNVKTKKTSKGIVYIIYAIIIIIIVIFMVKFFFIGNLPQNS